jgi:biopolymer transport protein ExbD
MRRKRRLLEKPKINMTPMIDMVFLLLTFFVLTFKIIVPEGDFNIRMSPTGQGQPAEKINIDSVQVRLVADENGMLSSIRLNNEGVGNFDLLRQRVSALCLANPDLEVVLCPDEPLHYEYFIQAITAVNGEFCEGHIRKICENIKFARYTNIEQ